MNKQKIKDWVKQNKIQLVKGGAIVTYGFVCSYITLQCCNKYYNNILNSIVASSDTGHTLLHTPSNTKYLFVAKKLEK